MTYRNNYNLRSNLMQSDASFLNSIKKKRFKKYITSHLHSYAKNLLYIKYSCGKKIHTAEDRLMRCMINEIMLR